MPKFRYIAPSGTPIKITDLLAWSLEIMTRKSKIHSFQQAICNKFAVKHCFFMSSGRAAMAMLFRILKDENEDANRCEIILPSYTCYSVPAAAELAGLKVRICDIDPVTLNYNFDDLKNIDYSKVLAITTANLFGIPNDVKSLEILARQQKITLIDDAAQSMNAKLGERYIGTYGDIGLFSLDKGKNITSIQGGIIVTNNDYLAELISSEISELPYPGFKQKLAEGLKLIIYSLLLHPRLYWLPANTPSLGLGKTIYTTNYLFSQYSSHLASIAYRAFKRVDLITSKRRENAEMIINALSPLSGVTFIEPLPDSTPVWLRIPLLINSSIIREKLLRELNSAGIGATTSYPQSIADLDEVKKYAAINSGECIQGKYIARHILTLPTMSYMNNNDISTIKEIFYKNFDPKT
ncbi:MAG: DegT/DnrJ/EryC1/StrS family aminotransferase [Gammaproteobacteria bacterium]|nr:DegT/DnrJ/EryC1/StrS family aminotransferase [Gammaproteobacteria bacterium]